jgi:hypothetical protein
LLQRQLRREWDQMTLVSGSSAKSHPVQRRSLQAQRVTPYLLTAVTMGGPMCAYLLGARGTSLLIAFIAAVVFPLAFAALELRLAIRYPRDWKDLLGDE